MGVSLCLGTSVLVRAGPSALHVSFFQLCPLNLASCHIFPLLQTTPAGARGKAFGCLKLLLVPSPQAGYKPCRLWSSRL